MFLFLLSDDEQKGEKHIIESCHCFWLHSSWEQINEWRSACHWLLLGPFSWWSSRSSTLFLNLSSCCDGWIWISSRRVPAACTLWWLNNTFAYSVCLRWSFFSRFLWITGGSRPTGGLVSAHEPWRVFLSSTLADPPRRHLGPSSPLTPSSQGYPLRFSICKCPLAAMFVFLSLLISSLTGAFWFDFWKFLSELTWKGLSGGHRSTERRWNHESLMASVM